MQSYVFSGYRELSVEYDSDLETLWCYFSQEERPCFSPQLLTDAKRFQQAVVRYVSTLNDSRIKYIVLASKVPEIFNLGGDLGIIVELIRSEDREALLDYATACVDVCYMNTISLGLPLTTISLVQGSALGGGFESALSSNVLIAEENTKLGLPEIRFNLFPGMGAFSFLARRLGPIAAKQMLMSGEIFFAEDLHEKAVVDVIAKKGKGYDATVKFIKQHRKSSNGLTAIEQVNRLYQPIEYGELFTVAELWVETAMRLSPSDLKKMERIVEAQNRCVQK